MRLAKSMNELASGDGRTRNLFQWPPRAASKRFTVGGLSKGIATARLAGRPFSPIALAGHEVFVLYAASAARVGRAAFGADLLLVAGAGTLTERRALAPMSSSFLNLGSGIVVSNISSIAMMVILIPKAASLGQGAIVALQPQTLRLGGWTPHTDNLMTHFARPGTLGRSGVKHKTRPSDIVTLARFWCPRFTAE